MRSYLLIILLFVGYFAFGQQKDSIRVHKLSYPPDLEIAFFSDSSFIAINTAFFDTVTGSVRVQGNQLIFATDTSFLDARQSSVYDWLKDRLIIFLSRDHTPLIRYKADSSSDKGSTSVIGKYYRGNGYHGYVIHLKKDKTYLLAERGHHDYVSFERGSYSITGTGVKLVSKKARLSKVLSSNGLFLITGNLMVSKKRVSTSVGSGKPYFKEVYFYFDKLKSL